MAKKGNAKSASVTHRVDTMAADAMTFASLKDLRKLAGQTQEAMAASLGVGQETISRLEKRNDMLLSTLHHYVESMGGQVTLIATFPDQVPVIIDHRGDKKHQAKKSG